ncbi:MAG: hydantoinase B/oxoprolinase family protein [Xanthobacteraceae bacterium]
MPDLVDNVTVQLLRNRIASLMEEMHYHFFRSGYSTIVRESRDFSCVITDRTGRIPVAPPMILHAPVYFHLISRILQIYEGTLEDGDVVLCNHPYEGNLPHASDFAVVAPIFHEGELVAFAGSIAHKADIGGMVPGSTYGQATEMLQEGMLLPPVKLYSAGQRQDDLLRLIGANSRQPRLLLGDLDGQVGLLHLARERVAALCASFGAPVLIVAIESTIAASACEFRHALAGLPDGSHEAEGFLDSDGVDRERPVRLHACVSVEGGELTIDLSGCDPQCRGPVNLRRALIESCCFYALIGLIDPSLRYSDGAREVVRILTTPGSVVDARAPAATSTYVTSCMKLMDVLLAALGPFKPERAIAHSGGTGGAMTLAWHGERVRANQYEIFGSSYGATANGDGLSGITVHLSNIRGTPIEILESEFPCRLRRFELIPDSGGAGTHRGGLSFRREYEVLAPATLVYRCDRAKFAPQGLSGGAEGAKSRLTLHPATERAQVMPSSCRVELAPGDTFEIRAAAGGGFGSPHQRDPAALRDDLENGYVTSGGLAREYGRHVDQI